MMRWEHAPPGLVSVTADRRELTVVNDLLVHAAYGFPDDYVPYVGGTESGLADLCGEFRAQIVDHRTEVVTVALRGSQWVRICDVAERFESDPERGFVATLFDCNEIEYVALVTELRNLKAAVQTRFRE